MSTQSQLIQAIDNLWKANGRRLITAIRENSTMKDIVNSIYDAIEAITQYIVLVDDKSIEKNDDEELQVKLYRWPENIVPSTPPKRTPVLFYDVDSLPNYNGGMYVKCDGKTISCNYQGELRTLSSGGGGGGTEERTLYTDFKTVSDDTLFTNSRIYRDGSGIVLLSVDSSNIVSQVVFNEKFNLVNLSYKIIVGLDPILANPVGSKIGLICSSLNGWGVYYEIEDNKWNICLKNSVDDITYNTGVSINSGDLLECVVYDGVMTFSINNTEVYSYASTGYESLEYIVGVRLDYPGSNLLCVDSMFVAFEREAQSNSPSYVYSSNGYTDGVLYLHMLYDSSLICTEIRNTIDEITCTRVSTGLYNIETSGWGDKVYFVKYWERDGYKFSMYMEDSSNIRLNVKDHLGVDTDYLDDVIEIKSFREIVINLPV